MYVTVFPTIWFHVYVENGVIPFYLVLYSFLGGHTNVSQNTFLGLFWSTGSYIAHGMRMTVLSMSYVLIATSLGLHGGSCPVIH
jgi:hypothetical protein